MITLGFAWARTRDRPVKIARERALEELVASLGDLDTDAKVGERLAALWNQIGIETQRAGRLLRQVQTGRVQNYALGIALGLLVMAGSYLVITAR